MKYTETELEQAINQLKSKGYGIIHPSQFHSDMEQDFFDLWKIAEPFTMTSIERAYALYKAIHYIAENKIAGDIVECGVWKGGSCILAALTLMAAGDTDRKIYLYDTFEGMPRPSNNDVIAWSNKGVTERWESDRRGESNNFTSWAIGLEEVKNNLKISAYPEEKLFFVKGPVEETLLSKPPKKIALLRLDTDWYESTKLELETLYPELVKSGVLIIDDYGHFKGAKKAVDNYFGGTKQAILLNRIDYTGRIGIKA